MTNTRKVLASESLTSKQYAERITQNGGKFPRYVIDTPSASTIPENRVSGDASASDAVASALESVDKLFKGVGVGLWNYDKSLTKLCKSAANDAYKLRAPQIITRVLDLAKGLPGTDRNKVKKYFELWGFEFLENRDAKYVCCGITDISALADRRLAMKEPTVLQSFAKAKKAESAESESERVARGDFTEKAISAAESCEDARRRAYNNAKDGKSDKQKAAAAFYMQEAQFAAAAESVIRAMAEAVKGSTVTADVLAASLKDSILKQIEASRELNGKRVVKA